MEKPVILLGFAQDNNDYLSHLQEEREGIEDALWNHISDGIIEVQGQVGMTIDKVFSYLKSDHYKERIKVFHYAGHANSTVWRLQDNIATVAGMASFFANVDLVVLNGCATRKQAAEFIKYGVKAVVASRSEIPDKEAKIFAVEFYRNLADGKTLEFSFDTALKKIHTVIGRPAQNQNRSMDLENIELSANNLEPAVFWELNCASEEIRNWTLGDAGHFDPSWLQFEEEERDRKDLEFRLTRFSSFEHCRSQMLTKLKTLNEVPAGVLVISGNEKSGQKWIAGNILRDSVSFLGENIKSPLNVSFSMETSTNPAYFWQQAREWLGASPEAVESSLKEETKFLALRLVPYLKKQPVIFRVYNDLETSSFTSIVTSLIEYFWKPFLSGFSRIVEVSPYVNYYPFVFLIIDEGKELDLIQLNSSELRVQSLPQNPPVTSTCIKAWLQWESENPALSKMIITPIIKAMTNDLKAINYYTGNDNSSNLETFLKKVCDDLQFQVQDNFSDENRLIYLNKNKATEVSPDLSLADFFS